MCGRALLLIIIIINYIVIFKNRPLQKQLLELTSISMVLQLLRGCTAGLQFGFVTFFYIFCEHITEVASKQHYFPD